MMLSRAVLSLCALLPAATAPAAQAQAITTAGTAERPAAAAAGVPDVLSPPDLAELVLAAPIILLGSIDRIERLGPREAGMLRPGEARYLVRAQVDSALVAPGPLPARVQYLWDGPDRPRPRLLKTRVLIFAAPVPGEAGQLQLVHRRAQAAWSPEAEARVRTLVAESRDPALRGRRPTGIQSAFSVAGSVPGESETQLFLKTQSGEPVSLVVLRRPGEAPRWAIAFGDAIDEAAGPPTTGTLARHLLACGLPAALPPAATAELAPADARRAVQDYALVRAELGGCGVTLGSEASSTATAAQSG
jgi:hypothetical protein